MKYLYNFSMYLFGIVAVILALFNKKLALFVNGRKDTFLKLQTAIQSNDKTIWMHCASLGEFEQGRPILEELSSLRPRYKIVLSFYSPSGFEVRKDYEGADVVVYLPIDTVANAHKFIQATRPEIAIFVKYEFWPNLLRVLRQKSIQTILVSGIFRADQIFFKSYGAWMKNSLLSFSHFFVQNADSENLLKKIGFNNTTISGDTRFDRVAQILEQNNSLEFLEDFVKNKIVLVAGSTWPVDESYLIQFINQNLHRDLRFIIAPHNINRKEIAKLRKAINCQSSLYSEGTIHKDSKVFIVDTIGILTKIYSYADIAYVGGGFDKEGVHNLLEPAVFGIPLVIGPVFDKFEEARELVELKGCLVANNKTELYSHLNILVENEKYRIKLGAITKNYIQKHIGATKIILNYIEQHLKDNS